MSKSKKYIPTKPRFLECIYEGAIHFDLEELGIDWDEVADYWIKYAVLHITFKDGRTVEHWGNTEDMCDYKWAMSERLLAENYHTVEELSQ